MAFNIKQFFGEDDDEVQMAPMIDMVFLLLIFFMVASHLNAMDRPQIEVPVAENAARPEEMRDRMSITIKKDEQVLVGTLEVELDQVGEIVAKERAKVPGLKIFLRADKDLKHKNVRDVMKVCADAGASEIIFSTYEKE